MPAEQSRSQPATRVPRDPSYWIEHCGDLLLIRAVAGHLAVKLAPAELTLADGVRVGLHGLDEDASVLVQCAPHRGEIKSTHRNMVLASALRLVWLRSAYYPTARAVLALSEDMGRLITPGAWLPEALRDLEVEVLIVRDDGSVSVALLPAGHQRRIMR